MSESEGPDSNDSRTNSVFMKRILLSFSYSLLMLFKESVNNANTVYVPITTSTACEFFRRLLHILIN